MHLPRWTTKQTSVAAATMTIVNPSGTNGANTDPLIKAGANDRRLRVHKITMLGGTAVVTVTEVQSGTVIWRGAGSEIFLTPLFAGAGQDLTIASAAATAISVQWDLAGA